MATHRDVLALAGLLAEQCSDVVRASRAISATALRRFADAADANFLAWTESLAATTTTDRQPGNESDSSGVRSVLAAITTSGVLLRVGCTLLHAVGRRKANEAAVALARETMRKFFDIARPAVRADGWNSTAPSAERYDFDQLTKRCGRLSDVLCGAMMPHTDGIAFVVDLERAKDFAHTFARFPALVRIPVRLAAGWLPAHVEPLGPGAVELTRTLTQCFTGSVCSRRTPFDPFTDLAEMLRPRIIRLSAPQSRPAIRADCNDASGVAFPTFSFAKIYGGPNSPP